MIQQAQLDVEARSMLDAALGDNELRIELFRLFATYENADGFEDWCRKWRLLPTEENHDNFTLIHTAYLLAWRELGDMFWVWMRVGHSGVRLSA